ncbi:acyltransferase [Vibrio vulnificus]|uniref:acyltransferase n=1 Tax=Vibrio vulnificus TaxID=672 RepID=UPI0007EE88F7|nr:acyltransferase [Vibrio vulnificus]ANN27785.1 hypothetical protein FORC17_2722 [Vibrio vulnificus]MCU8408563.1 acyltransferase [Vibrio vulnificus]
MKKVKDVVKFLLFLFKVKWIKTFIFNFSFMSFNQAVKLPILIFGKVKIISRTGEIQFKTEPSFGMIQIGKDVDHNPISSAVTKLNINGILIFNGHCVISGGSTITVWRGFLEIGKYVSIGSGVQLKATREIKIGDFTRIVALSTIMDTNVHYVKDINTGEIYNNSGEVIIGNNCWINQGAVITKGTILPDHSIVARNSFLNKNYNNNDGYIVLAGSPAKEISNGKQRIFDYSKEVELNKFFAENPEQDKIVDSIGPFVEPSDIPHIFKLR